MTPYRSGHAARHLRAEEAAWPAEVLEAAKTEWDRRGIAREEPVEALTASAAETPALTEAEAGNGILRPVRVSIDHRITASLEAGRVSSSRAGRARDRSGTAVR